MVGIGALLTGVGAVSPILTNIGKLGKDIREMITGEKILDPNKQVEIEQKLLEMESEAIKGQHQINAVEAAHVSVFVAGWRPFVGWVCGSALAYHFIIAPLMSWVFAATGHNTQELPTFEMGTLTTILMGMLGLGGLRTYEKKKGVNTRH